MRDAGEVKKTKVESSQVIKLPCKLGEEAFGVFPNEELPRFVKARERIQSKPCIYEKWQIDVPQQDDTESHRDKDMFHRNRAHLGDLLAAATRQGHRYDYFKKLVLTTKECNRRRTQFQAPRWQQGRGISSSQGCVGKC